MSILLVYYVILNQVRVLGAFNTLEILAEHRFILQKVMVLNHFLPMDSSASLTTTQNSSISYQMSGNT